MTVQEATFAYPTVNDGCLQVPLLVSVIHAFKVYFGNKFMTDV